MIEKTSYSEVEAFDQSSSSFMEYNFTHYVSPPKQSLNGGLYTGEEFHKDAPYRNFPNKADAVYLKSKALLSANPPPGATYQFTSSELLRPGNNVSDTLPEGLSNQIVNSCNQKSGSKDYSSFTCTQKPVDLINNTKSFSKSYFK